MKFFIVLVNFTDIFVCTKMRKYSIPLFFFLGNFDEKKASPPALVDDVDEDVYQCALRTNGVGRWDEVPFNFVCVGGCFVSI